MRRETNAKIVKGRSETKAESLIKIIPKMEVLSGPRMEAKQA